MRNVHEQPFIPCQGRTCDTGESLCWILSGNAQLRERVTRLLKERTCKTVESENSLPAQPEHASVSPEPGLIILDTGNDADSGLKIISEIRRRRIRAPMVVLTETFSKEFGSKILSQGVRYYFSHDFCEREFSELVATLLEAGRAQ